MCIYWNVVISVLKYDKGSLRKGLLYGHNNHTIVVCYSHADWVGTPFDRILTSSYCVPIGDNLISWKSIKQNVEVRFSPKVKYRAMATVTCELIWLKQLLKELQFGESLK